MSEYSATPTVDPIQGIVHQTFSMLAPVANDVMEEWVKNAENVDLTAFRLKYKKVDTVLKMVDHSRELYAKMAAKQAVLLTEWKNVTAGPSFFQSIFRQLLIALVVGEEVTALPACLAPIELKHLTPLREKWEQESVRVKEAQDVKDMKTSLEKAGDALAVAADRTKQIDAEFARMTLDEQRKALAECSEASTQKAQFMGNNVVIYDFAIQLFDLVRPKSGVVDNSAITAAVFTMCADLVAATDANSPVLVGCVKSHSCAKKFNSFRAVRMRQNLFSGASGQSLARQSLNSCVKEGVPIQDALMMVSPISFRLPVCIRTAERAQTPKKEEASTPAPTQEKKVVEKK